MTHDERVERVARAIANAASGFERDGWEGYVTDDDPHEWYREQARAAVAALDAEPPITFVTDCPICYGDGIVYTGAAFDDEKSCRTCKGTGSVQARVEAPAADAAIRTAVANAKEAT